MFTSDQTRQFYVVTKAMITGDIQEADPAGTIALKSTATEHCPYEPFATFSYKTPNGNGGSETVRTDLVPLANIEYVSYKANTDLRRPFKRLVLTPDADPVVGTEYSLAINFKGSQIARERGFTIYPAGHNAVTGDTKTTVLTALKDNLDLIISAQDLPIKATVNADTLVIEEVARTFRRGKTNVSLIDFSVSTVASNAGIEYSWATMSNTTASNTAYQVNGPVIANMEWFYLGERMPHGREGRKDDYFFQASYLANPSDEYSTIDISYFYKGNNEDSQHSRKVITLAFLSTATVSASDFYDAIQALRFPVEEEEGTGG